MDRNYFLSYGHKIALILLLLAVGKLNAKLISVATGIEGLPLCTDIYIPLLQYPADVSLQQSSVNTNALTSKVDKEVCRDIYGVYAHRVKKHFPVINGDDFFTVLLNDLRFIPTWYQWVPIYSIDHKNALFLFEKDTKIFASSARLVDGFKFIIKIPDKLTYALA